MKNTVAAIGAAVISLLCAGCDSAPPDTREADAKTLKDNETQWNKDFESKDADKLVAHYADDAVLMGSGMRSSSGKPAIQRTLKGMLADPSLSLKFTPSKVEVSKGGDLAYTQGAYTMTMTPPGAKKAIDDHGSYVTTYRKQADGGWKAVMDISTSEVPPPTPAPAPAAKKKGAKGKKR